MPLSLNISAAGHVTKARLRCGLALVLASCVGLCGCGVQDADEFVQSMLDELLAAYVVDGCFEPFAPEALFPPSLLAVPYEGLTLRSRQGDPVYAWFLPVDDPVGTVLIHHGAMTNRSAVLGNYFHLRRFGYNVMVYDYQGFGENENPVDLNTILDDADAALKFVQDSDLPGTDRIVLYGVSMGTLPAIAQAAESPERVVGVVLEGCFTSDSLPPLSYLLIGIVPWEVDISTAYPQLDPMLYIMTVTMPKLFIHSRQDSVTPFGGAEQLYALAPEPKQLVEVYGEHTASWMADLRYADILRGFLESLPDAPE